MEGKDMSRKNRSPEEKARRAKIRKLLQMANRSVDIFEQAIEQKKLS